jgi:hypothetical protein
MMSATRETSTPSSEIMFSVWAKSDMYAVSMRIGFSDLYTKWLPFRYPLWMKKKSGKISVADIY